MSDWIVTWWDGATLRKTYVSGCDAFNVVSFACGQGATAWTILTIERVAV